MTDNKLVSVIINNYNYEKFLGEAIESVLFQSYKNIELIIVDDGSTDRSREVIEKYTNLYKNIHPVYKENGGQASAYNSGVQMSTGDIICFLDSDDAWYPEKVEHVLKLHKNNDFVQHDVLKNGRPNFIVPHAQFDRTKIFKKYGFLYLFSPSSAISLTKKLADKIFPIPESDLRLCADLFVMFAATYLAGVFTSEEVLALYRQHDSNNWQVKIKIDKKAGPRKYLLVQELVNEWLFEKRLSPIPTFNWLQEERMLRDVYGITTGTKYIVYGTGSMAARVVELIVYAGASVEVFVDSSPSMWGTVFFDRPVIGPHEIADYVNHSGGIIIGSSFVSEILGVLDSVNISIDGVRFAPYLFLNDEEKNACDCLTIPADTFITQQNKKLP